MPDLIGHLLPMWPFTRKQSLLSAGVLTGWTDWHCHILPGVDDGIRTMEESLAALHWYESQGVREVWLTPHVMEDIPNTPEQLKARFEELKAAYEAEASVMPGSTGHLYLHLAAENMLDPLFEDRLESGDVLSYSSCPAGSSVMPDSIGHPDLLVETSYFNPPYDMDAMLERVKEKGYRPLLAHPERYVYMTWADYTRLHANGVAFQLNLPSLTGAYGPDARRKAERLLKARWYTRTGSDLHRLEHFRRALQAPIPAATCDALAGLLGKS